MGRESRSPTCLSSPCIIATTTMTTTRPTAATGNLCIYCHDNEHQRELEAQAEGPAPPPGQLGDACPVCRAESPSRARQERAGEVEAGTKIEGRAAWRRHPMRVGFGPARRMSLPSRLRAQVAFGSKLARFAKSSQSTTRGGRGSSSGSNQVPGSTPPTPPPLLGRCLLLRVLSSPPPPPPSSAVMLPPIRCLIGRPPPPGKGGPLRGVGPPPPGRGGTAGGAR